MRRRHHFLVGLLPFALFGPSGLVAQDSEGPLARWTLTPAPHLEIGIANETGSGVYRVAGVHRLSDGGVVALDGTSQELRAFSSRGEPVARWSRRGSGPGEFQMAQWLGTNGDTSFFVDLASRRISQFAPPHGFLRQWLPGAGQQVPLIAVARFSSGDLAVLSAGITPLALSSGKTVRDTVRVGVWRAATSTVSWLGRFPNATWIAFSSPLDASTPWIVRADHAPGMAVATSGETLWLSDTQSSNIRLFTTAGTPVGSARVLRAAAPYDREKLARARAAALATLATAHERAEAAARLDPALFPKVAPTHSRLIPAPNGGMWIELYREDVEEPAQYQVCDASGRSLAIVTGIAGFTVRHIDTDYVTGVAADTDGVETIIVRRIRR